MKPLQTILFFFFLLFLNSTITAQNLLEYISKDAALVAGINPSALKEKANFDAIREMEFYQSILDEISKTSHTEVNKKLADAFQFPKKYGMDFNSPSYFFVENTSDGFFVNYIFKLSDANKFNELLQEEITDNKKNSIQKRANYQLINDNGAAIAWDDKIVLIAGADSKSKFQGADISQFKGDVT
ncbi:MAG TPA: DUF4836 family protein, partial [Saprospiraceae bacterium]|nr:DUF4836 family protein [Saprospiraceae bacterium]